MVMHTDTCLSCGFSALVVTGTTRDNKNCIVNMQCPKCKLACSHLQPFELFIDRYHRQRMVDKMKTAFRDAKKTDSIKLLEGKNYVSL